VYLPDWREEERVLYTITLAALLDTLMPEKVVGSISTVPIGFRTGLQREDHPSVRRNLVRVLEHLDRLRQRSGKTIILALEPEPGCVLETTEDVTRFFDSMKFPHDLRDLIGICFDCCHQAVEFETPAEALENLSASGITIGKVQISSAMRLFEPEVQVLEKLCEPCYLHQAVIRDRNGVLSRYDDLPQALRDHRPCEGEEWRVHFHVPVFLERVDSLQTTRFFIEEALPLLRDDLLLEVETYTWEVLPPDLRTGDVAASIIREIEWVKGMICEEP
jgi:hypothetical protein